MKLALSVILVALTAGVARADDASATAAAKLWLDAALGGGTVTAPSKAAPLDHVFNTDNRKCRKVLTGRATSAKLVKKVTACLADAHGKLWFAPEDVKPTIWDTEVLEDVAGNFGNKKQIKKIKTSGKGATIVKAIFQGDMRSMYVWLAVAADGTVKGVYMQEILMD